MEPASQFSMACLSACAFSRYSINHPRNQKSVLPSHIVVPAFEVCSAERTPCFWSGIPKKERDN